MVWMEKKKGTNSKRKRCRIEKVVLGETWPVIEGESSARSRQDVTGVSKEKARRNTGVEIAGTRSHPGWALAHCLHSSFNYTHSQWQLPSCPGQLIHDCLQLYLARQPPVSTHTSLGNSHKLLTPPDVGYSLSDLPFHYLPT